tara:strand:- start:520 stop:630 length:111 start_codon:yes stop_codon:yes gene_type:complete
MRYANISATLEQVFSLGVRVENLKLKKGLALFGEWE